MSSTTPRPARPPRPADEAERRRAHQPEPVDIASESVAGEEDPGASAEPPSPESVNAPPARPAGPRGGV